MFRTELPIAPATEQLSRTARILTLGSCFADSIGSRLAAHKVDTLVNPFGTVFQPLALGRLLRAAAGEEVDWQQHLVEARGRWQSYDLHGSIGAVSPVALLQTIQEIVRHTSEFLRGADVVLLTLGTAWAYRLRETGELVNNCHKQPADLFARELLTPDDIINGLAETHAYLRRINPALRFVLTVSPVRHLKETLPLNAVSKSVLRVATHFVSDLLPDVAYFPAYELLMDDLRDYRFYAPDMLHPSEVAEDYIWEKFARTYFDADFGRFRKEWAAIRQSLGHRPLHTGAPEHRQFLESTLEKLTQLSLRKVLVTKEIQQVRAQLAALPMPQQPELVTMIEDDEERIDIGESEANAAIPVTAQPMQEHATAEDQPERLSPEEFRAQRATRSGRPERSRRDGRGKGQATLPTENEQFQAATTLIDNEAANQSADGLDPAYADDLELAQRTGSRMATTATTETDATGDNEESAKKKKRRSRGGAKRTARKNALRIATDEFISGEDGTQLATDAATETIPEDYNTQSTGGNTPVVATPAPTRQGGRRNGPGRVPRAELFAASKVLTGTEASTNLAPIELGNPLEAPLADSRPDQNGRNNRSNQNRDNRNAGVPSAAATVPAPAPTAKPNGEEAVLVVARQPRRSKNRVVSAARAEKPAFDTPVVPVPNVLLVRTQVAAGRMTGSFASLVAPTIAPKPSAAPAKVVPTEAVSPQKPASSSIPKTVKPIAKPAPRADTVSSSSQPVPVAKPKLASELKILVNKLTTPQPIITQAVPRIPTAVTTKSKTVLATPKVVATKVAAAKSKVVAAAPKAAITTPKAPATRLSTPKLTPAKPSTPKAPVAAKTKAVTTKEAPAEPSAIKVPAKAATTKTTTAKTAAPKAAAPKPAATKAKAPKKPAKPS